MEPIDAEEPHRLEYSTELSQERLRRYLRYDPETGVFTWLINQGKARAGDEAGSIDSKGYIKISVCGHRHGAHQLAWLYMYGKLAMIDHKDNVPHNNKLSNLRKATYSQNNHKRQLYNPLGHTGVRFRSGKYQAHIRINGVITRIGAYDTLEEASGAYKKAAIKYFGEFANEDEWTRKEET